MKGLDEFMLTGTCSMYEKSGVFTIMEFFGMDRHIKRDDLRTMIFTCLDFIKEFKSKMCTYKVCDNALGKDVISITVVRNEFFDDMFGVTVNDKQFGWIFLTKENKYPHLVLD